MKKPVSKDREMKDIRHKTEKGDKDMKTQTEDQVVDLFGMLAEGEMDPEEMLDLILSETDAPVVQENEMPMQQKKPGLLKKLVKTGATVGGLGALGYAGYKGVKAVQSNAHSKGWIDGMRSAMNHFKGQHSKDEPITVPGKTV